VALFDGTDCIAARHEVIGRGHAERLVPMIAELPGKGLADRISVNTGPGSFTGIRVGISAARALALAWNVSCEGFNGLALLAAIARDGLTEKQPVDVAILGGHGEYFFQPFDAAGAAVEPACSLTPEAAAQRAQARFVAGDAAEPLIALRGHGTAIAVTSDARYWPAIADLAPLPASASYVRGPDAKLPGSK
jgi:tRNA threonylcarbamoyl adenosine modification protein YeaZ